MPRKVGGHYRFHGTDLGEDTVGTLRYLDEAEQLPRQLTGFKRRIFGRGLRRLKSLEAAPILNRLYRRHIDDYRRRTFSLRTSPHRLLE